jgi:hypothetical protein
MGLRYNELRSKGTDGKAAVEICNQEFQTNVPYGTLRTYGSQASKQIAPEEHNECSQQAITPMSRHEQTASDELEFRMRTIAKEVCMELMSNMPTATSSAYGADMPPAPEKIPGGRHGKKDREYEKVSVTIDKSLWDRFTKERDSLRLSSGRLMDKILWQYFGRPALSYQKAQEPD